MSKTTSNRPLSAPTSSLVKSKTGSTPSARASAIALPRQLPATLAYHLGELHGRTADVAEVAINEDRLAALELRLFDKSSPSRDGKIRMIFIA